MNRFVLPAAASLLAGLVLGAAAVFGIALAAQSGDQPTLRQDYEQSATATKVSYGDRCFHGHCLPCNSKQSCLDELPPDIRDRIP